MVVGAQEIGGCDSMLQMEIINEKPIIMLRS
jgi:hypothetical protein